MNFSFESESDDETITKGDKQQISGTQQEISLGRMKVSQLIEIFQKAQKNKFEGFLECTLRLKNTLEEEQFLISLDLEEDKWMKDTPYYQQQKQIKESENPNEYLSSIKEKTQKVDAFTKTISEIIIPFATIQTISQPFYTQKHQQVIVNRNEMKVQQESFVEDDIFSDDSLKDNEIEGEMESQEEEKLKIQSLNESIIIINNDDLRAQPNSNQQEYSYPVKSLEEGLILWDYFENQIQSSNQIIRIFFPKNYYFYFNFTIKIKLNQNSQEEAAILMNDFISRIISDKLILSYSNFQAMKSSENMKKEVWDKFKVRYTFNRSFKKSNEFNFILYGFREEAKFQDAKQFLSSQNMIKMYFLTMSNQIFSYKEFEDQQFSTMLAEMRMNLFKMELKKNPQLSIYYEVCKVANKNKKSLFKHGVIFKFDNDVTIYDQDLIRLIKKIIQNYAFWILQTKKKLVGDDKFKYFLIKQEGEWYYQIFITELENFQKYLRSIFEKNNNLENSFLIILRDKVKTQKQFPQETAFQKFNIQYQNLRQIVNEAITQMSNFKKNEMEALDQGLDTFLEDKKKLFKGIQNNLNIGSENQIKQQSKKEEKNENIESIQIDKNQKDKLSEDKDHIQRIESQKKQIIMEQGQGDSQGQIQKKQEKQQNFLYSKTLEQLKESKLIKNLPFQINNLFKLLAANLINIIPYQFPNVKQNSVYYFFQGSYYDKAGWKLYSIDNVINEKMIFIFGWETQDIPLKELEIEFNTLSCEYLPSYAFIQQKGSSFSY